MAEIIYSKNGTAKATAKSVRYTGQFMGVPQLEVEIDGPVPLGFEVGDYIVFSYDGIRYSIMDLPPVTKQASAGSTGDAFVYDSVVFKSPLGLLANVDFLDTVLNENDVHYSTLPVFEFYGTVKDFADRLQANINRLHTGWKVSVEGYDDSTNPNYDTLHEYNNISISNIKCSDSLSIPYETWGITYVFMVNAEGNNCIVFNHALDSTSAKRYGEGNGLYTLTKRMSTEKPVANRLRAYGSTDNLPARYYNNLDGIDDGIYLPNLMIPRSKWKNQNDPITAYIDSTDIDENDTSMSRYGVREKSIYFDGSNDTEKIEPTIKGVTAGMIRAAKEEMGDTSNVPSATLYPDDERMDKIVEAESIADKGVESDGEVYVDSIGFNVSKGEDRTVVGTKNGLDPIIEDLETSMEISTPATYKVASDNPTPFCRFNIGVGIAVDSAVLNVYTVDEDGVKTLCDSVKIYSEVVSGTNPDGGRYAYRDFYFAGSNGKNSPLYIKVPYKGALLFQYNIVAGGADSVSLTMSAVSLTASTGPIILQDKFWVRIKQIGFDINSYPSAEEAKLVVNSGGCAGRSFNIVKNSTQFDEATGTWKFECFRSQDESLNQLFPNSIYKIAEDDEFVLTGLEMPDLYVQMASQKLYDEAVKWLWKHKDGLEVFDLDIDNKVAYLDSVKIKEGMLLPLYDGNLNVGSEAENEEGVTVITYDYRIIDSVTIEIGEEPVPVITAVLREEKEENTFKLLNKKVSEITARTTQNAVRMQVVRITEEVVRTTASTSASTPSAVIDTSDFVTLSTEQTITAPKTFAEDVTFGAAKEDGTYSRLLIPSTSGPGIYDIIISTEPVSGEAPSGSGGIDEDELWTILSDGSGEEVISVSFLPALASLEGNLDWSRVGNKPQWIGSSKPSYSYTEITGLSDQLSTYAKKDGSNATGTWGISISGDAATLGGVSKGGLLTSVTSTSATNLSVVVGGKTISVTDLYAAYADRLLSDVHLWGRSFNGSQSVSGDMSGVGDISMSGDIKGAENADFSGYVASNKLYLPYSGGNKVYDICISTAPVSGSAPEAVNGIDEDELWNILVTPGALNGPKIDVSHLPSLSGMNGTLPWDMVSGKPSTYAPSAHEHPLSEISDLGSGWSDVLDGKLGGRWGSLLNYAVPNWLEQTQAELGGYIPVHGDEDYWIATDSHTHDIDEIGGLGNGWATALAAAKPSWLTSVPVATDSVLGGFKTGFSEVGRSYAVRIGSGNRAYVLVPWTDTDTKNTVGASNTSAKLFLVGVQSQGGTPVSYTHDTAYIGTDGCLYSGGAKVLTSVSLSTISDLNSGWDALLKAAPSAYVTRWPTASEVGALTQGTADGRYAYKNGSNATGTWPISISGNAATADISNYLFLNPNNGTLASQNDAVPANGRFAIYDVNAATTAGGSDGYIMAFRWPSGNYASQIYVDVDNTGIMALRHRDNASVWHEWYRILHSGNIGSYALTKSNYTSTLDGRYMRIGSSGYPTAYRKVFNLNGTAWSFLGATTDAPTAYAPTTAGTSGYVLQSTGGTPKWISRATLQHELFTAGAGCSSIPANADLNDYTTPGVYYSPANATVSTWTNSPTDYACSLTVLVAAGVIQILREYGYSSSAKEFTRRYYNGTWTTWVQTPRMSDVYTRTDADSRYVNVSGDTMTGTLNINSASEALTRYRIGGTNKAASGYLPSQGAYLYSYPASKYLRITDAGSLLFGGSTVWHSGNSNLSTVDWKVKNLYIHGSVTSNSTRYITSDTTDNIYMSVGGVIPLVVRPECVRRSSSATAASITLGTSSYRWSGVYSVAGNFSGNVSASGTVSGDHFDGGYISNYNTDRTYWVGDATRGISSSKAGLLLYSYGSTRNVYVYTNGSERMVVNGSGNVGIGTTSPAYKLDVAGKIRAASGITIGSTDDYGWYIFNSRIAAGISAARGVNVGSLLVSSAWADYTKVPTNGIYCKGNVHIAGDYVTIGKSTLSNDYSLVVGGDAWIDGSLEVSDWCQIRGDLEVGGKMFIPSSEGNSKYHIRIE